MTSSRTERAALCALLETVGPNAPTLCEGWNTHDLAAHLVARERRPDSAPGLVVGALSGWTERVRRGEKRRPYPQLVRALRTGPPIWSWAGLPVLSETLNVTEFFVHHEDVRRAADEWEPRQLDERFEEELWRRLRASAGQLFRSVPVGLRLRRPDGVTAVGRRGSPAVELTGPASELLLFAFGRRAHARVRIEGDPAAVRTLQESSVGI
jgi:uncharacterized protein (TIGR03085 family)